METEELICFSAWFLGRIGHDLEHASTNAKSMENPLLGFEIRKVSGVDASSGAQSEEVWKAGVCIGRLISWEDMGDRTKCDDMAAVS
jgi:hypothetical protein